MINNIESLPKLLRAMASGSKAKDNHTDVIFKAAADLIEVQHTAIAVAVKILGPQEPGDSRAVSDEFVALYAVECGFITPQVIEALDKALAK